MKYITLLLFAIFFSPELFAQQGAALIGIKGGYTRASLWGKDVNDSLSTGGNALSKGGFNIGIGINSMIEKNIWLKHDLLLIQKGTSIKINDKKNSTYDSKFKLLYLDLYPCSPTFHLKGFQAFLGPYLGLLVNATIQRKDSAGNLRTDRSIYGTSKATKNYTQRIDIGFVAGLEYEFNFGLNIGIRYVKGFVPLIENPFTQNGQTKIYNQYVNLSIGYTLRRDQK